MTDQPFEPTETGIERVVDREFDERLKALKEQAARSGRRVEDIAMYVGLGQAALYGIGEFLIQMGLVQPHRGIPWMTIALFLGCILPKTVGRATAGKIWTGLGAAAADRLRSGK